jgi:sensitive to high expression protein 9
MEEKKPSGSSEPIAMPPPATEQKPASSMDRTPEQLIERQERLRREWEEQQRIREEEALRKKQQEEEARRKKEEEEARRKKREAEALRKKQEEEEALRKKQEQEALQKAQQSVQARPTQPASPKPDPAPARPPPVAAQTPVQKETPARQNKDDVVDNVKRVPDEHLPSHQERQRSNFEKRLSQFMDELLPKIAVVTQKVNTYTGTDYSGIEALRREIQEQGMLQVDTHSRCMSNTSQRNLSKLVALQSNPRKKPWMPLSHSKPHRKKRSLPFSNESTRGHPVILNATCPLSAPNT